jgi:hypothetical protein
LRGARDGDAAGFSGPTLPRRYERPGPVAGDGRLAAIIPCRDVVRLVDATTGRSLAALESPDPKVILSLCFAPDGTRLAAATDGRAVQVWDLRAIRRHLAAMHLDWDLPPLLLSGAGADGPIVPPVWMDSVEPTLSSPILAGARPPRAEQTGEGFRIERRLAHETC